MCGVLFNNVTECKKCPGVGVVCSKMPGANCSLPQCTNSRYVKKEVAEDGIEKTHFFAMFFRHVLVFYVRGIASKLKFPLCYIATSGVKAFQILSVFWGAVAILEVTCQLPVIATVCDHATSNKKFFRLYEMISDLMDGEITYRTRNIFATDGRYMIFF